jgi:protein O-GlcNAc transferase
MKLAIFDTWEYNLDTPYNSPLGGTQSAICYFLEEMKQRNHEIYLFNGNKKHETIKGVINVPISEYPQYVKMNKLNFDVVIVSCIPEELMKVKIVLNSPSTLFCLWTGHDVDQAASKMLKDDKLKDFIDLFIFVSEWQRLRYVETYHIDYKKTIIMKNGIGKPFEKYLSMPTKKKLNSMTYCSIPWRGLILLEPIYKEIKNKHNNASLSVFSGMNIYKQAEDTKQDEKLDQLKKLPDVNFNKGISQTKLAEELYNLDILTYPNIFPETSCITVLQAMACGCLVITSKLGALEETMNGLNTYINMNIYDFNAQEYVISFINKLSVIMNLEESSREKMREKNREHIRKNYTWKVICQKFEIDISNNINKYRNYLINNYKTLLTDFMNFSATNNHDEILKISDQIIYYPDINQYYIIKLNTAICLYSLGQIDRAKQIFKVCKVLNNDFNTNKNLAFIELKKNNIDKFIKHARNALNINFDITLASMLAEKYETLGLNNEVNNLFEDIISLDNKNIIALNNLGNAKMVRLSTTDDIDAMTKRTFGKSLEYCIESKEHRKQELVLSNIIFNEQYNWKLTEEERYNRSCVWYKYFPKDEILVNIVNKLNRTKLSGKKIRIGYISHDFLNHPVGFMFNSILKNHDVNSFEIFCYDTCDKSKIKDDLIANKLRSYNNAIWKNISAEDDVSALKILINDNLDILVDMMGHTRNTRMNLLQYKPARIIISYFAYPGTNGLNEVDYKFTDKYATPPETQKYFTEKLYCLPNGFQCYTPPIEIESDKNYTRDKYKIHLCCFNNPIKLSKPTIDTFVQILKRLPQAKLFLRYVYYRSSFIRESIIKLFVDQGIDKERIDIGHENIIEALKLYNKMDIVLDPFPYNGGTISSEAIYMNTPIITLAGTTYVSRVGVSLLSNLKLEKYIANTTEEYIQKVVDLANDESELLFLHQTLRFKMLNSDLANSVSFTKNIEAAYKDMCSKFNK